LTIDSGYEMVVLKGEDKGRQLPLKYREIHLGRRSQGDSDVHWIYFAEPTVSRHHATLVWDETRRAYTIYHKSRTNPTLVNGKPVQHCPLVHDDTVQVGLLIFRIHYVGTMAQTSGGGRREKPQPPPPPPERTPEREPEFEDSEQQGVLQSGLRLAVTAGPDRGSVYELDKPVLFIGRRDGLDDLRGSNGILLNDDGLPKEQVLLAWNERECTYGIFQADTSRLPTRVIRRSAGEFQTIHLDSMMQTLLRVDDVIQMGETAMQLQLDADAPIGAREAEDPGSRRGPAFQTIQADRGSLQTVDPDRAAFEETRISQRTLEGGTRGVPPSGKLTPPPASPPSPPDDEPAPAPMTPSPPWPPAEAIHFPTLDVNFVRSLPTRPPVAGQPAQREDTVEGRRSYAPPPKPEPPTASSLPPVEAAPPPRRAPSPTPPQDMPPGTPGLPANYRPPELFESEDDDEPAEFGETFSWKYRADYIIGFLEGRNRGQKVELLTSQLPEGRRIPVGSRGERTNEIEIDDPGVSNRQASITFSSGRFTLLNEGEKNSLYVNQLPLAPGEEMLLKTGDRIHMGETMLIFLERSVVQALSKFELKVVVGLPEDRNKSFDLLKEVVVVGRLKTCDIVLSDPEVSRKHLAITLRGGRFYLTHLSSSNPTFINGVSLPRGRDRILNEGDKVQLSDHTAVQFRARQTPKRSAAQV